MSESLPDLMRRLTLGVYVVGVCEGDRPNAFTACSLMPVSFDPVLLALAIGRDHASLPMLRAAGHFTVNVLERGQLALARHFGSSSAREHDKLAGVAWRPSPAGAPLLADALACLVCEVQGAATRAGDHELFVARVTSGTLQAAQACPMSYAQTANMDGSAALYAQRRVPDALAPHEPTEHH
ncbi:MAG TPA: flavin reductase family protein [Steroidobacteraceae bacterium]|jgi:flavin reductase (DIM6/NTAB) family NADH-FMN oxidoreductase RutF|nr:flavin reductase family protein [Steroidobacteraceae bacterium]